MTHEVTHLAINGKAYCGEAGPADSNPLDATCTFCEDVAWGRFSAPLQATLIARAVNAELDADAEEAGRHAAELFAHADDEEAGRFTDGDMDESDPMVTHLEGLGANEAEREAVYDFSRGVF